jgi:hypothetical protein
MIQVLTPEEMAALLEGLQETEAEPGFRHRDLPEGIRSRGRGFPEVNRMRMSGCQYLSNWLIELSDLRWPYL